MKTVSKNIVFTIILSSVLALAIAAPSLAVQETNVNSNQQSTNCARVSGLKTKSEGQVSEKITALQTNFANRLTKMTADQKNTNQQIANLRKEAQVRFEAKIKELQAQKNLTAEQIQTITAFQGNMQQAEAKREIAVDSARGTFRDALKMAVSNQQQTQLKAATEFYQSTSSAFLNAKTNCDKSNVMATLKKEVKTARQTMTQTREKSQLGETIKELAQTRTDSIKKANDEFKTSTAEYAQTLADALKTS